MREIYKIWWSLRSPLTQKRLQQEYYPAINYRYLNNSQILNIYNKENT